MQQGRFRATGMMNHHPQALRQSSVAILVTGKVGHFGKAHPGQSSKAPKQGAGNEIMAIERLLQTIYTYYRLPVSRTIMFLGRKALNRSDRKFQGQVSFFS